MVIFESNLGKRKGLSKGQVGSKGLSEKCDERAQRNKKPAPFLVVYVANCYVVILALTSAINLKKITKH